LARLRAFLLGIAPEADGASVPAECRDDDYVLRMAEAKAARERAAALATQLAAFGRPATGWREPAFPRDGR
jgi:hypothetical protein